MDASETRAPGRICHDAADAALPKRMMGCEVPDEHGPPLSVRQSGMAQVFGQPVTDIRRKRQPLVTIALAAHADRARAPVDIVEPELSYLVAPQAKPDQQDQDCQIAIAINRADIAGRKKLPHLIGFKPLGQPGQSAAQDRRHGRDERAFRHAVHMQKAEERPQRRDRQLRHPAIQTWAKLHHEGGDIRRGQAPEVKTSSREPAVQKRAQAIEVPKGCPPRGLRPLAPAPARANGREWGQVPCVS